MSSTTRTLATVAVLALLTVQAKSSPELSAPEIYQRAVASTLALDVTTQSGEQFVGAAFVVTASGLAVTAWHLVEQAREIRARLVDGTPVKTERCGPGDELHDLALLRILSPSLTPLPLRLGPPPIGSRIYAIGSPRGYTFSIVDGLLSQIRSIDDFPQYQLSCPFSPGNSGGPVLDAAGEVLGISSWSKVGAQNLNFAIPARFAADLCRREGPCFPSAVAVPGLPAPPGSPPLQDRDRETTVGTPSPHSFADFERLLRHLAGQPAKIVLSFPQATRTFEFVVPTNYVAPATVLPPLPEAALAEMKPKSHQGGAMLLP